jgi:hypothetical protein
LKISTFLKIIWLLSNWPRYLEPVFSRTGIRVLHKSWEPPKTPPHLWPPFSWEHHLGCMDDVWTGKAPLSLCFYPTKKYDLHHMIISFLEKYIKIMKYNIFLLWKIMIWKIWFFSEKIFSRKWESIRWGTI